MILLPLDLFSEVIASTPLVSIDIVLRNSQGRYFLGLRNNPPAKGSWFVPGGRIFKNETISTAFTRICHSELGIIKTISSASLIGIFDHFYSDSFISENISTHYVAIGYEIDVQDDFLPLLDRQHSDYKWFAKSELLESPDVHPNTKLYIQDN
ncbi:GDP-mannose mannosyl hydrolase [Aeromonas veronii]